MVAGMNETIQGIKLKELELEVVAHNLANSNTNGYKEVRVSFQKTLSESEAALNAGENEGAEIQMVERINFEAGSVLRTGNPLHVALQGDGFFEIQRNGNTYYTRNGVFSPDKDGRLVTPSGGQLMGQQGALTLSDHGDIQISNAGHVTVNGEEQGQIKVVAIEDTSQLKAAGDTLFKLEGTGSPKVAENVAIIQGSVESSNTNMISGLIRLVEISRQYEAYQKVIKQSAKLDQESTASLGKLT